MTGMVRSLMITAGVLGGMAAIGAIGIRSILAAAPAAAQTPLRSEDAIRQRGAYLVAAIGCNDCHSPHDQKGQLIPGKELSGHPAGMPIAEWDPSLLQRNILMTASPSFTSFAGPWGVSVAPNITPDKETGIGNLGAEALIRSWRTGKHWAAPRTIMPPMPSPSFANLSDDDIRAAYAFLMSLPPVKNRAPDSVVAPPPAGSAQ